MALDKLVDSAQLDADLGDIADAIRAKGGTSAELSFPHGFVTAVGNIPSGVTPTGTKNIYEDGTYDVTEFASAEVDTHHWHKPDAWPDLESVPLPGSYTENTWYLLYDRSIGYDTVRFMPSNNNSYPATVFRGTVVDGEFIGEQVAVVKNAYFEDTLTDDFTVYKVEGGNRLGFDFGGTTYNCAAQSVAWIYGECPAVNGWGSHSPNHCQWGIRTQRVKVQHIGAVPQEVYLTFPDVPRYSLKSLWIGYDEEGNFNGFSIDRTGNGPVYMQGVDESRTVTIQNAAVDISVGRFSQMRNVIFRNVTGVVKQQAFQDAYRLKSIRFVDCNLTCQSVYYMFSGCYELEYCDLSEIDFTGCTQTASFNGCQNLKTLILNNTWTAPLNLNNCVKLTHDSVVGIFNALPTISASQTITLHPLVKAYIVTAEEIAVVTAKGWTVA